ncbi:DUF4262 domain-containing protein [Spirillospora sp. CA-128828]|uniref:DUF4262 domain-containing protein n=1 Tax=Spirillospora sp. CA-128828 TaxID=3240033 RepID=UPI003D9483BF
MTEPNRTSACPCVIDKGDQTGGPAVDILISQVNSRGWAVVHSDEPAWSYTLGRWHNRRQPEFLICGRPLGYSQPVGDRHHVLQKAVVAAGFDLDLLRLDEVDCGLPIPLKVKPVRVHESWHGTALMRAARVFYNGELPEFRQLLWVGADENFPGGDLDEALIGHQPNLRVPRQRHPKYVWTALA